MFKNSKNVIVFYSWNYNKSQIVIKNARKTPKQDKNIQII